MTAQKTFIAVRVDSENNAEAWWRALGERYPSFASSLRRNDVAVIEASLWDKLALLPGWASGPEYAPLPLIDCGSEGERWADVVAQRHEVFEVLS